ncbi:MAG: hypothetical protein ACKVP3_21570 [Hyphomicrobiaceae bacterium]
MRTMLVLAVASQLAAFPASPQAQTPGVTKDEIRIGQTMPYSGNVSAYGVVGKAMQAYLEKINREQGGIKGRLLAPELVEEFVREFNAEMEKHRRAIRGQSVARERNVAELNHKIGAILKAVEDGMYHSELKDRMAQLEAERASFAHQATDPVENVTLLVHPNVPELYRRKVTELEQLLEFGEERDEAREPIRSMIDRVVSFPASLQWPRSSPLRRDWSHPRHLCCSCGKSPIPSAPASQLSVVAGTGFEPVTFRL